MFFKSTKNRKKNLNRYQEWIKATLLATLCDVSSSLQKWLTDHARASVRSFFCFHPNFIKLLGFFCANFLWFSSRFDWLQHLFRISPHVFYKFFGMKVMKPDNLIRDCFWFGTLFTLRCSFGFTFIVISGRDGTITRITQY